MSHPLLSHISYVRVGIVDSEGVHREMDIVLSQPQVRVEETYESEPPIVDEEGYAAFLQEMTKRIEVTISGSKRVDEPWLVMRSDG